MESNTSSIYQQFSQSGSTAATLYEKRPNLKSKSPSVKWIKEWVPQDILATGGKCYVLKWVTEETLRALKEKSKEPIPEPEPEPATEVLFLCSYEGCGKTFIDAGALRKHSLIHGERQFVCHYEGCGKKFLDSSKLKRHFLIHTGERDYVCPVEGCGKAFSLDFNLRSHMKTHSQENYHICPYQDCGKRYTHEYKLRNHIASYHEKNSTPNPVKYTRPSEKPSKTPRSAGGAYGSASSDRPFACPYEGCEKTYIHEYKLRLHLRREHPDNMLDENAEGTPTNADNDMDEGSDQDAYAGNRISSKELKQSRPKPSVKMPPAKVSRKGMTTSTANVTVVERPWQAREEVYREEDSEETEDDGDNVEEGWRFAENNEDDDEDTEYED